jgi:hypothetical protein
MDGEREYHKQMGDLYKKIGIVHEEIAPYTPKQNGVTEQANRMNHERIRAIFTYTKLPKEFWAELTCTICHLKSQSPTLALSDQTPYKALYGKKFDVSHLIAIGTKSFIHSPKQKTKNIDSCGYEGITVGYKGSSQYQK